MKQRTRTFKTKSKPMIVYSTNSRLKPILNSLYSKHPKLTCQH